MKCDYSKITTKKCNGIIKILQELKELGMLSDKKYSKNKKIEIFNMLLGSLVCR